MGVVGENKSLKMSPYPKHPLESLNRVKKSLQRTDPLDYDVFTEGDMTWAWFPSWTGWSVDMMKRLNNYTGLMNEVLDRNSEDIEKLNVEQKAIRDKVEMHEMAIESMSAALTGLCEMTEDYECYSDVAGPSQGGVEEGGQEEGIFSWSRAALAPSFGLCSGMKTWASFKKSCKVFSVVFLALTIFYVIYIVVLIKIALPVGPMASTLFSLAETKLICKQSVSQDSIIKVKNSRTYLIAAYLDLRGSRVIRILGITNRHELDTLICDFCPPVTNPTVVAEIQVHSDHFGFPYGTTDLLCQLPEQEIPQYVSVFQRGNFSGTFLKIQNTEQQDTKDPANFQYDFLVCISGMFGAYNNVLQFIQSMEMYQMLGAKKVLIYHTDSSLLMKKVLAFYHQLGLVDLIQWPITSFLNVSTGWHYPEHPGELHYYGQTAALNDCIYRNMYITKYIVLNDIDELILPIPYKDWPEMMEFLLDSNPTASVFIFQNHVFPTSLQDKVNPSTPEEWTAIPGLNILRHSYREPNRPNEYNPSKMILNPRSVVRTSVHVPLEFDGEDYQVPGDIAKLCHYRESKQKDLETSQLFQDDIMAKYEFVLVERVNRVLSRLELVGNQMKRE
ncbi:uncharacterized protein PAF06_000243 [Gastrophryne carolinensis]